MNGAITAAARRQAIDLIEREASEAARREQQEALMAAAAYSVTLLEQGLEVLADLLNENVEPDARFSRKAESTDDAPGEKFYLPQWSKYCHWYTPKQAGWYLTTSADWDGALRLMGESDLRVAILANGKTSRHLDLSRPDRRRRLAQEIIDLCARYGLVWPMDGPDLTEILEEDHDRTPGSSDEN